MCETFKVTITIEAADVRRIDDETLARIKAFEAATRSQSSHPDYHHAHDGPLFPRRAERHGRRDGTGAIRRTGNLDRDERATCDGDREFLH